MRRFHYKISFRGVLLLSNAYVFAEIVIYLCFPISFCYLVASQDVRSGCPRHNADVIFRSCSYGFVRIRVSIVYLSACDRFSLVRIRMLFADYTEIQKGIFCRDRVSFLYG